jgi:putative selenate reductase
MGDRMRPVPFSLLLRWMSEEYGSERALFGIPEQVFFRKENRSRFRVFDEYCDTPVGPAAGPHTQLTQNIVASYLSGGRWIEIKTVQKLDDLDIKKPCIDARDEGYNTEWSQELTLEESFDEYIKAWIILHLIEELFGFRSDDFGKTDSCFIFNMSVGYDLEGIKTPKMDRFISGMIDASAHPSFTRYLDEVDEFIRDGSFFESRNLGLKIHDLAHLPERVSPHITRSVTLSTMHGCPPDEIEAICHYLLKEKGLDTFVKLNPTLLGYGWVKEALDSLGYSDIQLKESTFTNDLQYSDAIAMLERLIAFSARCGRHFGVKLSNTLGTVNTAGILTGDEMYMSGRALFPLTATLASRLSKEFDGTLPISYSGGASQKNIIGLFETGVGPITVATELLKPGGYMRLASMAKELEPLLERRPGTIDVEKLDLLAKSAVSDEYYRKEWRGKGKASVGQTLPLFDCYVAPCVVACPIHQDVPEYIRLVAEGRYDKALDLIYMKNPLPAITGYICDHQCQYSCTRIDYEGSVLIREIKRIAAEQGKIEKKSAERKLDAGVAVIGAGPAGLAAAYFLARTGFRVTVFEKQEQAGGIVTHVLPDYRLPKSAVEHDISFIMKQGVSFKFGVRPRFSIDEMRKEGYKYIFIAIGAEVPRRLKLTGDNPSIYESLEFLRAFNSDPDALSLGRKVAVIGGGNTAMDSARSAMRVSGVDEVSILYRRNEEEMPADREEFENALKEGVAFKPLLLPESFSKSGILRCRKMALGKLDQSGRRRPVATEGTEEIEVDSLISAIGERPDVELLEACGLKPGTDGRVSADPETLESEVENVFIGGDAFRGPSTVVESIADARRAAEAIAKKEIPDWKGIEEQLGLGFDMKAQLSDIYEKKGKLLFSHPLKNDTLIAKNEALRCLECNVLCNKCVDVCPNRANIAVTVGRDNGGRERRQILHLDTLCNECGNCETFCPYEGSPYRDKFTLFNCKEEFENSSNSGFVVIDDKVTLRINGRTVKAAVDREGTLKPHGKMPGISPGSYQDPSGNRSAGLMEEAMAVVRAVLKRYRYLIWNL